MAPATPSEVPVTMTVKGIITINRITNGTERRMFTSSEMTPYSAFCSNICRGPVRNSSTPSGRPSTMVNSSEPPSMLRVSRLA